MHADDQHVHIVEAADAVVRMQFFLLCHEIFDRIPGIKDAAVGLPAAVCRNSVNGGRYRSSER